MSNATELHRNCPHCKVPILVYVKHFESNNSYAVNLSRPNVRQLDPCETVQIEGQLYKVTENKFNTAPENLFTLVKLDQ